MKTRSTLFLLCLLFLAACKKENTFHKYKAVGVSLSNNGYYNNNRVSYKALRVVMTQGETVYYSKVYTSPPSDPYYYNAQLEDSISGLFQAGVINVTVYEQEKKIGETKTDFSFNSTYLYATMDTLTLNVGMQIEQ